MHLESVNIYTTQRTAVYTPAPNYPVPSLSPNGHVTRRLETGNDSWRLHNTIQ